jgi:hypothetical protein
MTTMSPLKFAKIVHENEKHKGVFHTIKSQPCHFGKCLY